MTTWVPGADNLLRLHAAELPQKDGYCAAFWGSLSLLAAGYTAYDGRPVGQDLIADLAGSRVWTGDYDALLPTGTTGRRDFAGTVPTTGDLDDAGTSPAALARALEQVAQGGLAAVPVSGPWESDAVARLVRYAAKTTGPTTLIANPGTGPFWGSRPSAAQLVNYLVSGSLDGPAGDWDVGHFVALLGLVEGPAGTLVTIGDTYPTIGAGGVHLQPQEAVNASLRGDGGLGRGVLCLVPIQEARRFRAGLADARLTEGFWENGSPDPQAAAAAAARA